MGHVYYETCAGRLLWLQPRAGSCWAVARLSGNGKEAAGPGAVNTPGQGPGWHHFAPVAAFTQGCSPS